MELGFPRGIFMIFVLSTLIVFTKIMIYYTSPISFSYASQRPSNKVSRGPSFFVGSSVFTNWKAPVPMLMV